MGYGEKGILAIWHDLTPGQEDEMLDWYDREHHVERLNVPGFQSVRRYDALDEGVERLFIRYEVDSPSVLGSTDYLERVNNPTAWSLACQPMIRNNSRTVCQKAAGFGWNGGYAAAIRFSETLPTLDPAMLEEISAQASGICGAEFWIGNSDVTQIKTDEKRLRGKQDNTIAAALIVHATRLHRLHELTSLWQDAAPWTSTKKPRIAHYALSFELSKPFLITK